MAKAPPAAALAALLITLGSATLAAEPDVVATWNGGRLERADYESWLTYHQLEDGPEAIRERIFVESLAAISRERGAAGDVATRLELEATRQKVLVAPLRQQVLAAVAVSDDEIEALRRDHPEAFRRPRKLFLRNVYKRLGDDPEATRARMDEIREELAAGADFAALARRESESQSRFRDGALGFLDPDELPPPVAAAVRDLAPGQLSPVVEHGDGLSLFRCEEVRDGKAPTADEVRGKLRTNLLRQRAREAWARFEEDLLAQGAPRLEPRKALSGDPEAVVLALDGYELSAGALAVLVSLRFPGQTLADLAAPGVENLLRDWALGTLCVRRAVALGLDRDPEIAAALRFKELGILAQHELVRRVDARLREPSEEAMRRRFEADPKRYHEAASYELAAIHFGAEEGEGAQARAHEAVEVARRLEAGELSFEEAARRSSVDPSAKDGGRLGWKTQREVAAWGPVAKSALAQIAPGERTGLLHLESGLWLFELRARRDARLQTFEEAKPKLRRELRKSQIQELQNVVRQEQLKKLDVVLYQPSESTPPPESGGQR